MRVLTLSVALPMVLTLAACEDSNKRSDPPPAPKSSASPVASAAGVTVDPAQLAPFTGYPTRFESAKNAITPEKVELGKMLYFETRLSKNQQISCASCHDPTRFGTDGEKTSPGHKGQRGARNSPSTFNAAGHATQFWDGRAADVEEQSLKPITNPIEMALPNEQQVVTVLASMPEYGEAFKKAFPQDKDPLTTANVARAIGAFERTLTSPSRFDAFTKGDAKALTDEEKAGFVKFVTVGCPTCHNGPTFGGTEFRKLGFAKEFPGLKDNGRFDHTKQEVDRHFFKVPSLRNVEKTGPYLHDGSVSTLPEVVKIMGTYQLGKDLSDADVTQIVTFLKALTGEPTKVEKPALPQSTAKTPKPNAG